MKNYKSVPILFLMSLTLSSHAKTLYDPEDLRIFSETNSCQGCDLSGARIFKDHDHGSLINSYAIKTEFLGSLYMMDFSGSIMTYSKIGYLFYNTRDVQETNFDKVNLSYSTIIKVDLSGANFSNVDLSNSDLDRVNLSDVNFSNANLNNVIVRNSILIGANLTQEQLNQIKSIECTVMPNGELNSKGC